MSLLSFLKSAEHTVARTAHTVGHDVNRASSSIFNFLDKETSHIPIAHTQVQIAQKALPAARDLAVATARAVPRAGVTVGHSIIGGLNPAGDVGGVKPLDPSTNPIAETLLGSEPIKTVSERQQGTEQKLQQGKLKKVATPLSFLGVAGALGADALPVGPGKAADVFEKGIADLAKAKTAADVRNIMKGTPSEFVDKVAPAIANTHDPNVVKNILHQAASPPAPKVLPEAPAEAPNLHQASVPNPNDQAINGHLQTIRSAQSTTPELQDAIKGLKQTHEIRKTDQLSEQAKAAVEKDYTGSLTKVLTADNPSDSEIALGAHLIVKAQKEGHLDEAVNVAEQLDKKLREHGRAVQAGSIISRLSPEGQLLRAERLVSKAREGRKGFDSEQQTADELKQAIDNATPYLDHPSVQKVVSDISKDQEARNVEQTTGEALAKNVEKAVTPKQKQQTDALVAELTKKVKQESLDPQIRAATPPLKTLQEVFGRSEEAQKAYPEAQQILRDKFANDPRMSDALDKFFGSKLDIPAANSTVNRAIGDQLKQNGEKISQIIHKSASQQGATIESVAKDLVKEGFDPESAQKLSAEVSKRLDAQVSDAKKSALENLSRSVKPRNQPTFIDKVNKLSNLGALNDHDYLQLARAKLDLPHLKPDTAERISELSQQIQDLPEGHDKYAAVRELQHTIAKDIPPTKRQLAAEIAGLPRTIMASGDLSFGLRQGLGYATAHPITFMKAWPKQFQYFLQAFKGKDSEAYDALMADIRMHPDFQKLEKYGRLLDPTGHDVASHNEQFLSSDLAEKIPGVGRLVRGSNYAFTGLSNTLYANQFYGMLEHLHYAGIEPTDKMLKQIGEAIGTTLGRGGKSGGLVEKNAGLLASGLFAPRLIASRVNTLNPAYYIRLKGPARREALRSALGLGAFAAAALGTAKLAGADVSVDPRNADFGKIRVGDTRIDVLGGYSQYVRLGAQLATGQKINSTTGALSEAGKGLAGSRLDIAFNFAKNKENPTVSFVTDMLTGKDINGNSLYNGKGVGKEVVQRFIPLLLQDLNDLHTHPNSGGPGAAVAGLFGAGLQTYGKQDLQPSAKEKAYLGSIKNPEQQSAAKDLFQTIKVAPSKDSAKPQIIAAIKAGDTDRAIELAKQFNSDYDKAFDPWFKKNQSYYESDSNLSKEYRKGYISERTLSSWESALNKAKKGPSL